VLAVDLPGGLAHLPPEIRDAVMQSHAVLSDLGIPHVLSGQVAAAIHGSDEIPRRVEYAVSEAAFEIHSGGLVTLVLGMPARVGEVTVEYTLPADGTPLADAVVRAEPSVLLIVQPGS
jgi:hypothetical protein